MFFVCCKFFYHRVNGLVVLTHLSDMNLGRATTTLSFLVCVSRVRNDSGISDVDPISQRLYVMASSTFFGQSCAEVMTKYSLSSLLGAQTKRFLMILSKGTRAKHFDIFDNT